MDVKEWLNSISAVNDTINQEQWHSSKPGHNSPVALCKRRVKGANLTSSILSAASNRSCRYNAKPPPPFERRLRYKPRVDLYEPYADVRRRGNKQNDAIDAKKPKRKPKGRQPRRGAHSYSSLLEAFRAQSVMQARLTLPQQTHYGFFERGKVSFPQQERNRGLRDSVFSETPLLLMPNQRNPASAEGSERRENVSEYMISKNTPYQTSERRTCYLEHLLTPSSTMQAVSKCPRTLSRKSRSNPNGGVIRGTARHNLDVGAARRATPMQLSVSQTPEDTVPPICAPSMGMPVLCNVPMMKMGQLGSGLDVQKPKDWPPKHYEAREPPYSIEHRKTDSRNWVKNSSTAANQQEIQDCKPSNCLEPSRPPYSPIPSLLMSCEEAPASNFEMISKNSNLQNQGCAIANFDKTTSPMEYGYLGRPFRPNWVVCSGGSTNETLTLDPSSLELRHCLHPLDPVMNESCPIEGQQRVFRQEESTGADKACFFRALEMEHLEESTDGSSLHIAPDSHVESSFGRFAVRKSGTNEGPQSLMGSSQAKTQLLLENEVIPPGFWGSNRPCLNL